MAGQDQLEAARAALRDVDGVGVVARDGGIVVEVATAAARGAIALQGAQVLSWRPAGHADVLWCTPRARLGGGGAIRGGVPICWPWFGPDPRGAGRPQHGYARNADWQISDVTTGQDGRVVLAFTLPAGDARQSAVSLADIPGRGAVSGAVGSGAGGARADARDNGDSTDAGLGLSAFLTVTFGAELSIDLVTRNGTDRSVPLTHALHTYLAVADAAAVSIDGLDGVAFRDNTDGGRLKVHHGSLRPQAETIALFDHAPDVVTLTDPGLGRRMTVRRTAGRSTIVWQPGAAASVLSDVPPDEARRFVCIESGSIGVAADDMPPGGQARIGATYAVAWL